ncbi:MAG: hypothetical protein V4548_03555 [Bacteroidota bacterium]
MKITCLLISLFFITLCYSQENFLKITNSATQEESIIKENKRIRILTVDGKKLSGKFSIVDENSIMIKNTVVNIDQIVKLKRHPLGLILFTDYIFIYTGAIVVALAVLVAGLSGEPGLILLAAPGVFLIHAGSKGVNILGSYKTKQNWKYEIQMTKTNTTPELTPVTSP